MKYEGKVAVFIDGANLYATSKALNFDIDYKALLEEFKKGNNLVRVYYYTAIIDTEEFTALRPLVDWLSYNGYTVVTKSTKEFTDGTTGRKKIKGNMDVELVVDALELAPHIDTMILLSGDGDFRYLVSAMQRKGVFVIVISSIVTQPSMIADELRRQADKFIDLDTLKPYIGRERLLKEETNS